MFLQLYESILATENRKERKKTRSRLGWRRWRQKINLWVRVPSGGCCYQLEEQQTDLRGSIDCRGRVRCTGSCSPRSDLASETHGRPVKRDHPRNNNPRGQPVCCYMSCEEPEHSWTHQTYRHQISHTLLLIVLQSPLWLCTPQTLHLYICVSRTF